MKTKKFVCYVLVFLPLVITLIMLPLLPDQIPAHYGMDNQVTRWGSKYETLILPIMIILFGIFMLIIANHAAKKEKDGKNNEKVCILATIISLSIFNIMTLFFLYTSFNKVENLSLILLDSGRLLFGCWGCFMVIIGNVMPKLRINSLIGLRTKWSMKNETAWKKSQFYGGISFIIGGIIIIAICLFLPDINYSMWVTGILLAIILIDVFITYRVAQKY